MKNNIFNYLTLLLIYVSFSFFIVHYFRSDSLITIYNYIGLAIMIPSIFFFTLARIKLGSSFQASAAANNLVTDGIYKKLRHPIYYFGLAFIIGLVIFFQVFYSLMVCIAIIFLQIKRIKKEEEVLEEEFGDQYLDYKKNTWF